MKHRLQGYIHELGAAAANAFDLQVWGRATTLDAFGVELRVQRGAVEISLQHIAADGRRREFCRLDCLEPGSVFSPPIFVAQMDGVLLPVLERSSEDAGFDLYFGTNQVPELPAANIAFIQELHSPDAEAAAVAALGFLQEHFDRGGTDAVQLVGVDSAGLAARPQETGIAWIANDCTGGALGIGRGLYEACYGSLAQEGFTHLCLPPAGLPPHPEYFARAAALMRFLKPGFQVCGPDSGGQPEPEREPVGWHCMDVRDIHRNGLPCPLPEPAARQEYSARMRAAGLQVIANPALPCQAAPASPPCKGSDWALRLLMGTLPGAGELQAEFAGEVQDRIAAGDAEGATRLMNSMDIFLGGPQQLFACRQQPVRAVPRPPFVRWQLNRRLRSQLARISGLSAIARSYDTARWQLGTIAYWGQMGGNRPPSDPARAPEGALQRQQELSVLHLKSDNRLRGLQSAWSRQFAALEGRLEHNRLLDTGRSHADQDRASQIMMSLLRDRHKGRRAVIVGNGPSLRISDLDRLQADVTFASNKIYLAYGETFWRPTYYSVEDGLVIQNSWDQIAGLQGSIKIFPANVRDFGYHAPDTIFVPFLPPKSFEDPLSDPGFPSFSTDLSHGICWGSTIVYSQIQMALFMGCSEIILIGVDHSYQLPSVKRGNQYLHEGEQNHFHPGYRQVGEAWHQPNLDVLEVSYARARESCAARGVQVLNASRRSCLEVFERADFDTLFPPNTAAKESA
ncbi:hypothetical protein [Leisingera sp. ANG-M7]|uniref:hypothetical protein n=1 Tax=Leisingera sp. ANG-M7 TaxID=1577902 RepID=UPI00057DA70A|nr:hypothetical protein [Leisingera sp. ANG-M7]KIC36431.1 hypothetical protein RA26_13075 [Leisingera sp. ANG-M7]